MTATDPTSGLKPGGTPAATAGARTPAALTREELQAHVIETRARLAGALDALEDRANLLKHCEKVSRAATARLRKMNRENRLGLVAVALGGVVVAGLIAAAAVKAVRKR